LLDSRFSYRIWPCTNPSGYILNTRANAEGADVNRSFGDGGHTPEAEAIAAANRDQSFALSIDLHEDCEADGFYCFERFRTGLPAVGLAIVQALDIARLPVQSFTLAFDFGYPASAERAFRVSRGHVLPDHEEDARVFGRGAPYSVYMFRTTAQRTLTFESPQRQPWETRIAIHRLAVQTAIGAIAANFSRKVNE
jgi:hypothetical protein